MRLEVKAPAKINLSLKVLGRRVDGYHEIESLIAPLELSDRLIVAPRKEPGVGLICRGAGLPQDQANLAWAAAALFLEKARAKEGLEIILDKEIPIAAGLGGGSSDAAAVLKAANDLFGQPFSTPELEALGLRLGADVPFFIQARPAYVQGIGERLTPVRLPAFHCLLVNPGFEVKTSWIYGQITKPLTWPPGADSFNRSGFGSLDDLQAGLELKNDLEAVVEKAWPVVGEIRERLIRLGARLAQMSGSGPTVYGLFSQAEAARQAVEEFADQKAWRVILTQSLT